MLEAALLAVALNRDAPEQPYGPQPSQAAAYAPLQTSGGKAVYDTRPGLIRPAARSADTRQHDDEHRGFACVDSTCKTTTPVYTSRTPLEQEQGRLGTN
ncbi:hypothetical protein [Asticcacaulis sp. AC402]|uniref:hypothetical protein n=1 Tax=Asticcacaulis sp. AC402 TaxID=1282361 RepID=UPI0003C3F00C|nr:hypothetical protein [Asticcacaulis sp. AC402]ESQ73566.1 hypothetical protein ABAC402_18555 [Asticcacaulis sp. AC402]